MWSEESSYPRVELEAALQLPGSPGPNIVMWITLREELDGLSLEQAASYLVQRSRMQLIDESPVRLPVGMADAMILKDGSRGAIGYVVIKDQTPTIVTFLFRDRDMGLLRPTMDAVVRTLTLD